MNGKIIVISAPSGCGKSTIIDAVMNRGNIDVEFSVSATNRPPREGETHGVHYWFLTEEEFNEAIMSDLFVEYEEVFPGRFYGTLKSEITNKCNQGKNLILDIDVKGAINVKKLFGDRVLTIFIEPPSMDELMNRLKKRGSETLESLAERMGKARFEMTYADKFDCKIVNDDLEKAIKETESVISDFINQ